MKTFVSLIAFSIALILYLALPPHIYFSVLGLGVMGAIASAAAEQEGKEESEAEEEIE